MCGLENYLGGRIMDLVDVHSRVGHQPFSIIRLVANTVGVVEVPLVSDHPKRTRPIRAETTPQVTRNRTSSAGELPLLSTQR